MASENTVKAVERTLDLMEFLRERGPVHLSTIADELGLAKSTAHRHLRTLEQRGYVTSSGAGYVLSLRFLDFGEHTRMRSPEYQLAAEKVTEVATRTEERAQFMVEEHGQVVYVYQQTGQHAVEANTYPGKRVPIHASAAGLAILSQYRPRRVDAIINQHGLATLTPKTITDPETLHEELNRIRERGYSINDQGVIEGLRAIGAPVTDPNGAVIGGLSVSGPINRMEGEWFDEELPSLLLGATNELELNIAYQ